MSREPRDELIVATPAAGKTRYAMRLAHGLLRASRVRRILIVVPALHLKRQVARNFARSGIRIEWRWDGGRMPADAHGAAVTYAQVAHDPASFSRVAHHSFSVFDEIHHASTEASWGQALLEGFEPATHRLAMSGTIDRTDGSAVPFVEYDDEGFAVAGYRYPYSQGVADGVCRPTAIFVSDGEAEWIGANGERFTAVASQAADHGRSRASEWLRTQQYFGMSSVLEEAHESLLELRRTVNRNAGGLIVARDQEHARFLARLMYGVTGDEPALVVSDEEDADKKLEAFSKGRGAWIVAVHKVSEGVDIQRLMLCVYGSAISTHNYLEQVRGRIIRATPEGGTARFYIPAHPKIMEYAASIEREVRVGLAARRGTTVRGPRGPKEASRYEGLRGGLDTYASHIAGESAAATSDGEDTWDTKETLRREVNGLVNQLARKSGQSQATIHGRLNARFHDTLPSASEWSLKSRVSQLELLLIQYERS